MSVKTKAVVSIAILLGLAACDVPPSISLPENVVALAGPNQDLSSARLNDADNCYWYDHKGIVETTPLPLRTANGQQICVERKEETPPAT